MAEALAIHSFTIREVIGALLPDQADCENVKIKTKQGILTIEVHEAPAPKGGDLSRRAALLCGSKGFWTFLEVSGEDKAKATIYAICGITSRAQLDHQPDAAKAFRDLEAEYTLWLNPPF